MIVIYLESWCLILKNKFLLFINDYINFYFKGILPKSTLKCIFIGLLGLLLPILCMFFTIILVIYRYISEIINTLKEV